MSEKKELQSDKQPSFGTLFIVVLFVVLAIIGVVVLGIFIASQIGITIYLPTLIYLGGVYGS